VAAVGDDLVGERVEQLGKVGEHVGAHGTGRLAQAEGVVHRVERSDAVAGESLHGPRERTP
jgi:hypothetical protein